MMYEWTSIPAGDPMPPGWYPSPVEGLIFRPKTEFATPVTGLAGRTLDGKGEN